MDMQQSMALLLQEPLAAVARVRRGEGVSDAALFRRKLIENFQGAEEQARIRGYTGKYTKLAIFAVAAMLDETVLGSGNPVFAGWPRQPLCLEVFSTNLGGEIFFDNTRALLEGEQTADAADVLEVHLLCLLLGFAGKYKNHDAPEIRQLTRTIRQTIDRIRGAATGLPTLWALPREVVATRADALLARLKLGAIIAISLVVILFAASKFYLISGANGLADLAERTARTHE